MLATALPFFLPGHALMAQGVDLPLNSDAYPLLDRLEVKTGLPLPYHSSNKAYPAALALRMAFRSDTLQSKLTAVDRQSLSYLIWDNADLKQDASSAQTLTGSRKSKPDEEVRMPEPVFRTKPLLRHFYQAPASFFALNRPDFFIRINPVLNAQSGLSIQESGLFFANQRGIEIRGGIDDRLYFSTNILESQVRFLNYATAFVERYRAVPGSGFFKYYKSSVAKGVSGYDFLNAQGMIGFRATRHVGIQFGHGKNFIGDGVRSLFLSDFSNNYLYLKINTQVWKFHYQNLFAELAKGAANIALERLVDKKYLAAHHLSFQWTNNFNLGLFEAVIFNRKNGFELQYLNPLILYRTVEGYIGSPDNVLIGMDAKWNIRKKVSLYGQLLFDEFRIGDLVRQNGYWANKYGLQVGMKYVDALGVPNLDLQVEMNTVRPYAYSHFDSLSSYSHYQQPLAHPLGANFREMLGIVRYRPAFRWTLELRGFFIRQGDDTAGQNWGSDILNTYVQRPREYGNEIGQGVASTTLLGSAEVSYQFFHNMFLDFNVIYRKKNSDDPARNLRSTYVGGGVRINFWRQRLEF